MAAPLPVLVGDVGGTNARFAVVRGAAAPVCAETLACADFPGLDAAVRAYLDRARPPAAPGAAALGVAAPVDGDRVRFTNRRAWSFSIAETRARLGFETLHVVNDFAALALSVPELGPDDTRAVGGGAPRPGAPVAVLGPGTGLGMSGLLPGPDGGRPVPLSGEGGHAALAPVGAREAAVAAMLARRFGHVSIERAVSGPGLVNLAAALAEIDGRAPPAAEAAEIASAAAVDPVAAEALAMFAAMLGTAAADLALTLGARGGVYIGGGVVPRLGGAFPEAVFRARFEDKGRFGPWLAAVPTRIVTRPDPAFLGLAALARRGLERGPAAETD